MPYNRFCRTMLYVGFAVALAYGTSLAQDWPQWRGPGRDGVVTSFVAPKAWPDSLKLKWKITVGAGHSSPVVAGGKVFLHSRQEEKEVVSCFDLVTGKLLWQDSYPAPYKMHPAATGHGRGPKSTPVFYNGKLYTMYSRGDQKFVIAVEAATGKTIWEHTYGAPRAEMNYYEQGYGPHSTPLIIGDLIYAVGAGRITSTETGAHCAG